MFPGKRLFSTCGLHVLGADAQERCLQNVKTILRQVFLVESGQHKDLVVNSYQTDSTLSLEEENTC